MRYFLTCLLVISSFIGFSQDLEFTWLRPVTGNNYREVTEFMDIALEGSGNILLAGSAGTCYGPVVMRLDIDGQVKKSIDLQIPNFGYGRAVRIFPLEGGKSVLAAWGGMADDYGGWNGHVIFLDSLFNIISRDTFETYSSFIDLQAYYQYMDIWGSGDSVMVAGLKRATVGSDYIKILTFDANTLMRVATDSFAFNGPHVGGDGKLPIVPFSDSIMVGYNHKLSIYEKGVLQPVYSDSLVDRIWDVARHGTHYWLMTEGALIEMDQGLNAISHHPLVNTIDRGFFVDTQDTLYAVMEMDEEKMVYNIPFGGTFRIVFQSLCLRFAFIQGHIIIKKDSLLLVKTSLKGTVMETTKE